MSRMMYIAMCYNQDFVMTGRYTLYIPIGLRVRVGVGVEVPVGVFVQVGVAVLVGVNAGPVVTRLK